MLNEKLAFRKSKEILNEKDVLNRAPNEVLDELTELVRFHERRYYVENDPIISDREYDQLFALLQRIENENPELVHSDSPTQRVGSDLSADFKTVRHLSPMLSLANSYNEKDLNHFHDQVIKALNFSTNSDLSYVVEPKLDGGTVVLIYENDQFVRAATRGNGYEGDDISANIKAIPSVPLRASFSSFGISRVEIRAEAIISLSDFAILNKKRQEEELSVFANPRNAATGGLRMKDPSETAARKLQVLVFQVAYAEDDKGRDSFEELEFHSRGLKMLGELGFKLPPDGVNEAESVRKVHEICSAWEEDRASYPYEIDGMVVKVDKFQHQRSIGSTSHHPKWAMAYKFRAKQATTKLNGVEFQVGKIGSITPVAKLDPIPLAGVTVESASLHNEDFIKEKDLRIGDQVIVERAGDVIPYIVKSLKDVRIGNEKFIQFPRACPACNQELKRIEGEAAWRCVNAECPAQLLQKLIHFVSKNAMDIDGFGRKYIELFYELGFLRSIVDIYQLDFEKIKSLEGFGDRSAQNLKAAIEKSKSQPLYRLLHGLSIHHVGLKMSKVIASRISHALELSDWSREDLLKIPDVGPIVAENVASFFENDNNIKQLEALEKLGVNLHQTEDDVIPKMDEDAVFAGKTILFTGSLESLTRKEAQRLAEKNGAKNISAVSGNLDILVVGKNAGSKLRKAKELETIEIISENEFLNRIHEN